jgi:hypothetical protein
MVRANYKTPPEDQAAPRVGVEVADERSAPLRQGSPLPTLLPMRARIAAATAALLLGAGAARAQVSASFPTASGGPIWSATSIYTVGENNNVFMAEAGWPGLSFTYLRGATDRSDIGGRINFNYGFQNTTNTLTGVDVQVPYRFRMTEDPGASVIFLLQMSPGASFYSNNGSTLFGIGGPIGVLMGKRVSERVNLNAAFEIPVLLSLANPFGVIFGPLFGVGGEYFVEKDLLLTARIRVGPQFALDHTGETTELGVQAMFGLAYNMR